MRFIKSLTHALRGMRTVWQNEANFRIQVSGSFFILLLAILLRFSYAEMAAIIISIALVLSAEMLNTILEEILDIIEPRFHMDIGKVKDISAGVVLLLAIFAGLIGIFTIAHHFIVTANI